MIKRLLLVMMLVNMQHSVYAPFADQALRSVVDFPQTPLVFANPPGPSFLSRLRATFCSGTTMAGAAITAGMGALGYVVASPGGPLDISCVPAGHLAESMIHNGSAYAIAGGVCMSVLPNMITLLLCGRDVLRPEVLKQVVTTTIKYMIPSGALIGAAMGARLTCFAPTC